MKQVKKILILACCALLLVCISVGATLAYLTQEKTVTNTFSVGKVVITLDEADVDEYGVQEKVEAKDENDQPVVDENGNAVMVNAPRTDENEYKLIPGHEYKKDPTIHVEKGSEPLWLFVKVENGITNIEAATTIADQMKAKGWAKLTGAENADNVYVYCGEPNGTTPVAVDARTEAKDIVVFESFKLKTDADVAAYGSAKITVTAYAIQEDGLDTAAGAWNASGFGKSAGDTTNP